MPQTPWIRGCEQCSQLIEENDRLEALLDEAVEGLRDIRAEPPMEFTFLRVRSRCNALLARIEGEK